MEYLTVKQTAKLWGISERRIINLIKDGRIPGSFKNGMCWSIPKDAHKPVDKRNALFKETEDKKIVVIAGVNSDIGKSLCKILLEAGYRIIGLYQKNSPVDKELKDADIQLKEIDYFDRQKFAFCNSWYSRRHFWFCFYGDLFSNGRCFRF